MTDGEINAKIARRCGWHHVNIDEPCSGYAPGQGMPGLCKIPDYVNNLNAMHEAECTLAMPEAQVCFQHLHDICFRDAEPKEENRGVWHATARQRAEAFLKL